MPMPPMKPEPLTGAAGDRRASARVLGDDEVARLTGAEDEKAEDKDEEEGEK